MDWLSAAQHGTRDLVADRHHKCHQPARQHGWSCFGYCDHRSRVPCAKFCERRPVHRSIDTSRFRCGTTRLSVLQLQSSIDIHGRLRLDVRRVLSRELRTDQPQWRQIAKLPARTRGADSGALHSHLRHDVGHCAAQALWSRGVARWSRSHVTSVSRAGNVRTACCLDVVWLCDAFGRACDPGPKRASRRQPCGDCSLHDRAHADWRLSRRRQGLRRDGRRDSAQREAPLHLSRRRFLQAAHFRSAAGCGVGNSVVLGRLRHQLSA